MCTMWSGILCALVVKCGASYAGPKGGNGVSSTGSDADALVTQTNASCLFQLDSDVEIPRRSVFDLKVTGPDETLIPTNKTLISSKDFIKTATKRDPTYRITQPGTYVLQEDIVLDFGEPDTLDHPFHFGFVMGVMISADNVRLDLNGKTIRMSERFANRQRFFNIIELAHAPYPKGKAGFTDDLVSANNVIIENGRIGRSSHGAIHGNNNDRILLRDLTITNFEVAAIGLNSGRNIIVERNVIDNSDLHVPVHSTFAIAWMLNRTLSSIRATATHSGALRAQADEYMRDADLLDILQSPGSDKHRLTDNASGKPEGSVFGIYLSSTFNVGTLDRGVLSTHSQNVVIRDVTVRNVASGKYEMVGLSVDNKAMLDSFGNRVHWTFLYDDTGVRLPLNTTLNQLKYKLAKIAVWSTSVTKPDTMPKTFVEAILDKDNLMPPAHQHNIFPLAGTDSRKGHSPKGTFGIRLDGVQNARVENCTVDNITNNDTRGSVLSRNKAMYPACPIVWRGKEGSRQVYKGNYAFGISLSSCANVDVLHSNVTNVRSENGNAFGMAIVGPTRAVSVAKVSISNVTVNRAAYEKVPAALPNLATKAMVWYKEEKASDIQFRDVTTRAMHSAPENLCTGKDTDSPLCPGPAGWSITEPTCRNSTGDDSWAKHTKESNTVVLVSGAVIAFSAAVLLLVALGFFYVRRKYAGSADQAATFDAVPFMAAQSPRNSPHGSASSATPTFRGGRAFPHRHPTPSTAPTTPKEENER